MKKKEIMHLFILRTCTNDCPLCCNKFYDIDKIPVATVEELQEVHTVCITGGEPFLYYDLNIMARRIKEQFPNVKNIYVYTSGASLKSYLIGHIGDPKCLSYIDGVNVAPKSQIDWIAFESTYDLEPLRHLKSNRLYVFDKSRSDVKYEGFETIPRVWDKIFNTPDNEIFRRLPILLD